MKTPIPHPPYIIRPGVPEEVFTDRQDYLDFFHNAALKAITRRTMSTVLLGQRRMGKTEIFLRTVNRLFWEQDHQDPKAAVPVYFSFPDEIISRQDFALKYTENFVRWYAAFRLQNPKLLREPEDPFELIPLLRENTALSEPFRDFALGLLKAIPSGNVILPEEKALLLPRAVSDYDDSTVVMFLDEFQNTHLPEYEFRVVGFMQQAVESTACPHFVTGSAMSILSREIIGRGALFGRFSGEEINTFSPYWGSELVRRATCFYRAEVPELMAPVVADRCGGNPFYITAIIRQAAKLGTPLVDEESINKILAVDISSGFIWGELHDQVTRWIKRINEHGITKWILYLSAICQGEKISLEQLQQELKAREGRDVPLDTIRDILVRLSRGDLVDYLELGGWFRKINDPILLEFLKVWGRIEVEGQPAQAVQDDLREQYEEGATGRSPLQRRFHEYKGYLGEVFMSQILLGSSQKVFPGRLFHTDEDITMPWRFTYVHHRVRLGSGQGKEIDLYGAAGSEVWIGQSKWTKSLVGLKVLKELWAQGEQVRREREREPRILRLWLFAYNGLTAEAEEYARAQGILWSAKEELNELLLLLGLRKLPDNL
ncbi:hypothetical protein [Candidatus Electrothrix sp.]|uniref:hypothetical protein n=1 Tax=Candidatus Electrothrix sp. TaxID=2170559 RepID=UPI004057627D